jgi:putative copper resistance protein D
MRKEFCSRKPLAAAKFVLFLFLLNWIAATPIAGAQDHPMNHEHAGHEGMNMAPGDAQAQAKLRTKILADKKESEFNHHLAGLFIVIAGVFILFQSKLIKRWSAVKYVWPACFLLAGLFVFVWSDTELWPFGHRQWLEALQNNREVLQHKTFAVLLLALGAIEWQRARGVLRAAWSQWVFPAVAVIGSVLLIFHQHEGGMVGEHHMETMQRIQSEHMSYLVCGLGIGLTNGLSGFGTRVAGIFGKIWPLLMVVLGVMLMFYKE